MSDPTDQPAGRGEDETSLAAGVPGPSGTGEQTQAGADPDAPTAPASTQAPTASKEPDA